MNIQKVQIVQTVGTEFFGSMNWLRGKMLDGEQVATEIGRFVAWTAPIRQRRRRGDSAGGQASNETENRIEGRVLSSTFLGDQVEGRILIAKALTEDERPAGNVSVHLPKRRLVALTKSAAE